MKSFKVFLLAATITASASGSCFAKYIYDPPATSTSNNSATIGLSGSFHFGTSTAPVGVRTVFLVISGTGGIVGAFGLDMNTATLHGLMTGASVQYNSWALFKGTAAFNAFLRMDSGASTSFLNASSITANLTAGASAYYAVLTTTASLIVSSGVASNFTLLSPIISSGIFTNITSLNPVVSSGVFYGQTLLSPVVSSGVLTNPTLRSPTIQGGNAVDLFSGTSGYYSSRVYIGTTGPSAFVHINGTDPSTTTFLVSGSSNVIFNPGMGGNGGGFGLNVNPLARLDISYPTNSPISDDVSMVRLRTSQTGGPRMTFWNAENAIGQIGYNSNLGMVVGSRVLGTGGSNKGHLYLTYAAEQTGIFINGQSSFVVVGNIADPLTNTSPILLVGSVTLSGSNSKLCFPDATCMTTAASGVGGGTTTIKPQIMVPYDVQLASQGFGGNDLLFYTGYSTYTINSAFFNVQKSTVGATVARVKVTTGTHADFNAYGVPIAAPVVIATGSGVSDIFWFSSATIPAHQWIGVDVEQVPQSGKPPKNLTFNPTLTPQ